jgi:hypothetical protein
VEGEVTESRLWKEFMDGKISWWEYIQKHMFEDDPPFELSARKGVNYEDLQKLREDGYKLPSDEEIGSL